MIRRDYRSGGAGVRNPGFTPDTRYRVDPRRIEAAARIFHDRRPGRPKISYRTAMMQDERQERRRRARNVAWIVGFGLLGLNILIGVPTCSGTGEGAGSDGNADAAGPASAPAPVEDESAPTGDRSD